jgi:RND family efflux transporter MFP subunit
MIYPRKPKAMSNAMRQCRGKTLLYLAPTLAITLLAGCKSDAQAPASPPPTVSVAQPLAKSVTDWDEYTGRIEARESVEVRARVNGYLNSIYFREGAIVKKGDPLFVIDPRPYEAALTRAQGDLAQAENRLSLAINNVERAGRLLKSRAISEEEFDTRRTERQQAEGALQSARGDLTTARLNVDFTRINAPITGRIGRKLVTEGNLVNGGTAQSTLLTTIVSLDPIHFYFSADEQAFLRYVRLDQSGEREISRTAPNPVRLRLGDEKDYSHEGKMDFVDNRVDVATGTVQGRAIFPNSDLLLTPGLFAQVLLKGRGPYNALLIPDAAVGTDQAQRFVYVIDQDNVAKRRQVRLGRWIGDSLRIVEDGVKPEDRVVINGLQRVQLEKPVTPQEGKVEDPGDNLTATAS